jgi:3-oxoacyl-[acyl-carrier protein] reductase
MDLQGHVALVTGAQQGIGAAVAEALGAAGASVIVNALDDLAAAEDVAERVRAHGPDAVVVRGDVASTDDVEAMVEAGTALGGIDLLVNNAGIFPRVALLEMTDHDWDRVFDVNLKGTFRCTRAVCRRLVAQRRPGAVVSLASVAAFRGSPLGVHYASTKAGIVGFTRSAAAELAPQHIRVNAVAPGIVDTAQPRDGLTEEQIAVASSRVPLGAMAQPSEIADVVAFLLSDAARHMTGQTLHVNGGAYAG